MNPLNPLLFGFSSNKKQCPSMDQMVIFEFAARRCGEFDIKNIFD